MTTQVPSIRERLAAPFSEEELEWKPQHVGKNGEEWWCQIVPYISARAIQDRLDEVFGLFGWELTVHPSTIAGVDGVIATLKVRLPANEDSADFPRGWVTRQDGSDPSDMEPFKGAITGAFKRVAVHFGIGRYLYAIDGPIFAIIHANGKYRARGKTRQGDSYNFRWDVPPEAIYNLTGTVPAKPGHITEDGEVALPPAAPAPSRRAASPSARAARPAGGAPVECPSCTGPLYDNRAEKASGAKGATWPDFKCQNRACGWAHWGTWPPKEEASGRGQRDDRGPGHPDAEKVPLPDGADDLEDDDLPY